MSSETLDLSTAINALSVTGISIDSLADIDITGISNGQGLVWNSSTNKLEPGTLVTPNVTSVATGTGLSGGTITSTGTISLNASIGDLNDVTTSSIADGQILVWNTSNSRFQPANNTGVSSVTAGSGLSGGTITSTGTISLNASIGDLTDVTIASITDGQILAWNTSNSRFEPVADAQGITSVATGTGLSGGTITSTGTISLSASIGDLTDVTISSITDGQILAWNTSNARFEPVTNNKVTSVATGTGLSGGTITSTGTISLNASIGDLNDVDLTGNANNYVLKYNSGNARFEPVADAQGVTSVATGTGLSGGTITSTGTISLNASIGDLTDVDITGIANGQVLAWNTSNSRFEPTADATGVTSVATGTGLSGGTITSTGTISLSAALNDLTDVSAASPSNGDILQYNSGSWVAGTATYGNVNIGGNSVLATMNLGTTNSYGLNLITNNTTALSIDTSQNINIPNTLVIGGTVASWSDGLTIFGDGGSNSIIAMSNSDNTSSSGIYFTDTLTPSFTDRASIISYGSNTGVTTGAERNNALVLKNTVGAVIAYASNASAASTDSLFEVYTIDGSTISFQVLKDGSTAPGADNTYTLGTASYRWSEVYAATGTINTSDRNQKTNIETSDLGLQFIRTLEPVSYKFKDYQYKSNNELKTKVHTRTHYGFIAQDVETAIQFLGKTTKDFAGFIKTERVDPITNEKIDSYGLRYTEFIAPIVKAIQEIYKKTRVIEMQLQSL